MTNLSQRYISALAQLSQFICVQGDKSTLTHVLTGVQVSPASTEVADDDSGLLQLTFSSGHIIEVIAALYFELQLAEDAAHNLHSVGEGSGEIHKQAKARFEHLSTKYDLS